MLATTGMRGTLAIAFVLLAWAAHADSLFSRRAAAQGTLIADQKVRFAKGDLITVVVREIINASTQSDQNTRKEIDTEAEAEAGDNQFLVADNGLNILKPEELPNWQIEANNESRLRGQTIRRSQLTTTVTCQVVEVFENGNVLIHGVRRVTVNREDSQLVVSGLVRGRDVSPSNTVQSSQIANATIELRGKGPLWNNTRRGLFTRFLDWVSPF